MRSLSNLTLSSMLFFDIKSDSVNTVYAIQKVKLQSYNNRPGPGHNPYPNPNPNLFQPPPRAYSNNSGAAASGLNPAPQGPVPSGLARNINPTGNPLMPHYHVGHFLNRQGPGPGPQGPGPQGPPETGHQTYGNGRRQGLPEENLLRLLSERAQAEVLRIYGQPGSSHATSSGSGASHNENGSGSGILPGLGASSSSSSASMPNLILPSSSANAGSASGNNDNDNSTRPITRRHRSAPAGWPRVKKPECPVCLDEFDINEHKPQVLPCGHSVCETCKNSLIRTSNSSGRPVLNCPLCRHNFFSNEVTRNNIDLMKSTNDLVDYDSKAIQFLHQLQNEHEAEIIGQVEVNSETIAEEKKRSLENSTKEQSHLREELRQMELNVHRMMVAQSEKDVEMREMEEKNKMMEAELRSQRKSLSESGGHSGSASPAVPSDCGSGSGLSGHVSGAISVRNRRFVPTRTLSNGSSNVSTTYNQGASSTNSGLYSDASSGDLSSDIDFLHSRIGSFSSNIDNSSDPQTQSHGLPRLPPYINTADSEVVDNLRRELSEAQAMQEKYRVEEQDAKRKEEKSEQEEQSMILMYRDSIRKNEEQNLEIIEQKRDVEGLKDQLKSRDEESQRMEIIRDEQAQRMDQNARVQQEEIDIMTAENERQRAKIGDLESQVQGRERELEGVLASQVQAQRQIREELSNVEVTRANNDLINAELQSEHEALLRNENRTRIQNEAFQDQTRALIRRNEENVMKELEKVQKRNEEVRVKEETIRRMENRVRQSEQAVRMQEGISEMEMESAKMEMESAKTEMESAKTEMKSAKTEMESAKNELESARVKEDKVQNAIKGIQDFIEANKGDICGPCGSSLRDSTDTILSFSPFTSPNESVVNSIEFNNNQSNSAAAVPATVQNYLESSPVLPSSDIRGSSSSSSSQPGLERFGGLQQFSEVIEPSSESSAAAAAASSSSSSKINLSLGTAVSSRPVLNLTQNVDVVSQPKSQPSQPQTQGESMTSLARGRSNTRSNEALNPPLAPRGESNRDLWGVKRPDSNSYRWESNLLNQDSVHDGHNSGFSGSSISATGNVPAMTSVSTIPAVSVPPSVSTGTVNVPGLTHQSFQQPQSVLQPQTSRPPVLHDPLNYLNGSGTLLRTRSVGSRPPALLSPQNVVQSARGPGQGSGSSRNNSPMNARTNSPSASVASFPTAAVSHHQTQSQSHNRSPSRNRVSGHGGSHNCHTERTSTGGGPNHSSSSNSSHHASRPHSRDSNAGGGNHNGNGSGSLQGSIRSGGGGGGNNRSNHHGPGAKNHNGGGQGIGSQPWR